MGKISQFFRAAIEGQTVDGREITRPQIDQMATNYDQTRFGARIWNNHYRGILPDSVFAPMGDVLACKAEDFQTVDGTKRCLMVQISALPNFVEMYSKSANIFWSIELDDNFAGSGQAYLVGLAPTDDPASCYTEPAKFSAGRLEATRQQYPGTRFTRPFDPKARIEWLSQAENAQNPGAGLMERIKGLFHKSISSQSEIVQAMEAGFGEVADRFKSVASQGQITGLETRLAALESSRTADRNEFAALRQTLSHTPDGTPPRPTATGGGGYVETDC